MTLRRRGYLEDIKKERLARARARMGRVPKAPMAKIKWKKVSNLSGQRRHGWDSEDGIWEIRFSFVGNHIGHFGTKRDQRNKAYSWVVYHKNNEGRHGKFRTDSDAKRWVGEKMASEPEKWR